MPLMFENLAAKVFFGIFFALFIAASLARLFFCIRENALWRKITAPLPMLFLGTALVCLAPQFPFLHTACYLSAFGAFFREEKSICFIVGVGVSAAAYAMCLITWLASLSDGFTFYDVFVLFGVLITFAAELARVLFKRKAIPRGEFYALLFYFPAQLCIYFGMILSLMAAI